MRNQQLHPFAQHNTLTALQFLEKQCFLICITILTSLETGWCTGQIMQTSQNQTEHDSTSSKFKKIFCFSYWINVMQSTLSPLLPYPINTIRIFYLTLLTNCKLVPIFEPKEEHLKNIWRTSSLKVTIFVDIITRNKNVL